MGTQLPPAARESVWLRVEVEDGVLTHIAVDLEETESARQRIAGKMGLYLMAYTESST
jgi:hypothetical protein